MWIGLVPRQQNFTGTLDPPGTAGRKLLSEYPFWTIMHRKPHLPTKICATCNRPFTWRRKWARDWAQVRYCSERCRRHRPCQREDTTRP
nr:DUF2256 domain-containing protein [Marinobacter nanhaiticus]